MISVDTNVLIYATAAGAGDKASRARELLTRAIRSANSILLLQTLAEFSSVAIRKAGIPAKDVARVLQAWCAVLPIQPADEGDLFAALEAVHAHRLAFWDAMLWASAQRAGVKHLLTEDFQDGFVLGELTFINPFSRDNDRLIERLLPPS
jgi:predicted nucleic acid-binding protein